MRFLLTPLREGRPEIAAVLGGVSITFLLTPLREGRPAFRLRRPFSRTHFYSRPCGRGDSSTLAKSAMSARFLLTPLREGRRVDVHRSACTISYFYSRPCGRGDCD